MKLSQCNGNWIISEYDRLLKRTVIRQVLPVDQYSFNDAQRLFGLKPSDAEQ